MTVRKCILLSDGTFDLDMGLLVWMKARYYGKMYKCIARSMLVVTDNERILLDTGCGEIPENLEKEYNFQRDFSLLDELKRAGYSPEDISIVVNTHLHFDHCGWNKAFKKARFIVQKAELAYAKNPHKFQRDGYHRPFFDGIGYELIDGDSSLTQGVNILFTPGHTPGHQSIVVSWRDRSFIFCGDTGAVAENIIKRNVIGITTDPVKCLESIDRLRAVPNGSYIYAHDNAQPSI